MFVNQPVTDLKRSKAVDETVGLLFNPQFTDDTAACRVISEHCYAMLLTQARWKQFSQKPFPDAHKTTGVLVALALDSSKSVDTMVEKAVKAGGKEPNPKRDYGVMVKRTFADLDGHTWEPFFMDPAHVQKPSK